MASANSGLQITNLDFGSIKSSLKSFLQQQDTLKDYNFEGSGLSVLVDLLSYNTQYNAYYLNMVANEMFLDSAVQRNSVVSHAKMLNYTPRSAVAPKATIKLAVNQVVESSLTLPKFTTFISEAIDGTNYYFVTTDAYTVNVSANTALFNNLQLAQGVPASFSYTVNTATNPKYLFEIPDSTVDTATLTVTVQESSTNAVSETYTLATQYNTITPTSKVYFLQEGMNGKFQLYFGDGILGKAPINNNVVNVSYITTNGLSATGANSFTLTAAVGAYSNTVTTSISAATNGADKETIDSIKYSAPKAYAAQGRAVTKEDYIYLIQNNSKNVPVESVSVWGGEENDPPVYGKLFCAIKPSGGYTLSPTQKQRLISDVIKPISVVTVTPEIVDPDYNYIKVTTNVLYDAKKTTNSSTQIRQLINDYIRSFGTQTLNTFNSILKMPDLIATIQTADPSIVTNDTSIRVQKKFYPSLTTTTTYELNYGFPIKRNYFNAGITSYPGISVRDSSAMGAVRSGVFLEEVPTTVGGVQTINVVNQGFNYSKVPTVTITGDGSGAQAYAVLAATRVINIVVTNPGINYTQAIVTITPDPTDGTGGLATATAVLEGSVGVLRTYYYVNNTKTILNANAGTVDYYAGKITLTNFSPVAIDNDLGQFVISAVPESTIVESTFNKLITIDDFDPDSVVVTVNASQ